MSTVPWWFRRRNAMSNDANAAQISVYDDFINGNLWTTSQAIGAFPGLWTFTGNAGSITAVTPSGAQNGIVSIAQGAFLQSNLGKAAGTQFPLVYSNISKIVARFVFLLTSIAYSGTAEAVLGFVHTGTNGADGGGNLYGAYINFSPGYTTLPDWNTQAALPAFPGFTYGVYNGQAATNFGYKPSAKVATVAASTWYEGIISMIPGQSCSFYIGPYGAPALDRVCQVTSLLTNTASAGPVITMGAAGGGGVVQIDKAQYAIWVTEGNKALTDSQLYGF